MSAEARGRAVTIIGYVFGVLVIGASVAAIPTLRTMREALRRETMSLREARQTGASTRDSLADEIAQLRTALELQRGRASARAEKKLHLVIAVDSSTLALMRDGITLRTMPARFRGAAPERGTRTIARIATAAIAPSALTVDSMGNRIAVAPDTSVKEVILDDGTIIAVGDAASALLGSVEPAAGRRAILVSKRDFDAIRPNFARGMKAVLF